MSTYGAFGNIDSDGGYVANQPQLPVVQPGSTTRSLLSGVGTWGKLHTPLFVGDLASLYDAVGRDNGATNALTPAATDYLSQSNDLVLVREDDASTGVAAVILLKDSNGTPAVISTITANCTGSRPNASPGNANPNLILGARAQLKKSPSYSTAAPLYDLTITMPDSPGGQETWPDLNAASAGAFSASTLIASVVAAINNGTSRAAKSRYWTAAAGVSVTAPVDAGWYAVSTAGVDGITSITDALCLGVDGYGAAATGVYAAKGLGISQMAVAGLTTLAVAVTLDAYAATQRATSVAAFASGTATAAAITAKLTAAIASGNMYLVEDFIGKADANGNRILVNPTGLALGVTALTSPFDSVGNKPRTGVLGYLGTEQQANPVSSGSTEAGLRARAGIGYFTTAAPRRGGLLCLGTGMSADGINGIHRMRTTYFFENLILNVIGPFVDEMQGDNIDDDFRNELQRALDSAILQYSVKIVKTNPVVDFNNDLSQYTNLSVSQGIALTYSYIKTKEAARRILSSLIIGPSVAVPQVVLTRV